MRITEDNTEVLILLLILTRISELAVRGQIFKEGNNVLTLTFVGLTR